MFPELDWFYEDQRKLKNDRLISQLYPLKRKAIELTQFLAILKYDHDYLIYPILHCVRDRQCIPLGTLQSSVVSCSSIPASTKIIGHQVDKIECSRQFAYFIRLVNSFHASGHGCRQQEAPLSAL